MLSVLVKCVMSAIYAAFRNESETRRLQKCISSPMHQIAILISRNARQDDQTILSMELGVFALFTQFAKQFRNLLINKLLCAFQ